MRPIARASVVRCPTLRRAAALTCAGALLAGCGGVRGRTTADPARTGAAGAASLASHAGTWVGRSIQAGQDTAVANWRLVSTADTSGWSVTFLPGSPPLPVRVLVVEGDSVVTEIGPYPSPTRAGVRLVTRTAGRFRGDRFTGTYTARPVGASDSTALHGRVEATRAP
jgi:hypothetical protein